MFRRAIGAALVGLLCSTGVVAQQFDDVGLKTAFVYNFVQFVDWQPSRLRAPEPLVICSLEDRPISRRLPSLAGRLVKGHRIEVRTVYDVSDIVVCHVLFVSAVDIDRLPDLAVLTRGGGVLLVAEESGPGSTKAAIILGIAGNRIVFDVVDSGIGISPEELECLFTEFSQSDTSTTRKYGGTGLGLAISRRLVELMGGQISVESVAGEGSTFTVSIPTEVSNAGDKAPGSARLRPLGVVQMESAVGSPTSTTAQCTDGLNPMVLIVDDNSASRNLATRSLERGGYRTAESASSEEGLAAAYALRPDVVTLDIVMPGESGWGLLTKLKRDPEVMNIPVIMVSIVDDESQSLALGADVHLVKPVQGELLLDAVRAALDRTRNTMDAWVPA